jgi:signal transduction histidine kinase
MAFELGLRARGGTAISETADADRIRRAHGVSTQMRMGGNSRPVSVPRAVAQFALSGLVVVVVVGVAGAYVLRSLGTREAVRDARDLTELSGKSVVAPVLSRGVVTGDKRALVRLDRVVRERVLHDPVVRVKLWTAGGKIVYSDKRALIGSTYPLGSEEQTAFRDRRVRAELSDLTRPENRFERSYHKLLEVYLPVHVHGGGMLLYEQYLRYSSVLSGGHRVWTSFLPVLIGGLLLLALVQLPIAWSLARRLRERQREREALLMRAIDSSNLERRRIAADLHDGVVQNLAGLSFSLAAAAERLAPDGPEEATSTLRRAAAATRQTMRQLRSLLVEIYPPNLHVAGLEAALSDVVAPAVARGLDTHLDVSLDLRLTPEIEALVFRTAQEGVRNVLAHAQASRLDVRVAAKDHRVELIVEDDGRGFDPREAKQTRESGHFGISLLRDLAASADATLDVTSEPERGTVVRLEVPTG